MITHFNSTLKNKKLIRYLLIGFLNTIFAYISGVVFFNLFYKDIGALLLTLLTTIINIFFTFINYKFFYFKTHKKYSRSKSIAKILRSKIIRKFISGENYTKVHQYY